MPFDDRGEGVGIITRSETADQFRVVHAPTAHATPSVSGMNPSDQIS
jgi:hypothetical protein